MKLHHVGVGVGQGERGADAAGGADRAEQIGVVIALVGGLARPRSAPGPLPNLAVLLADPGLVLQTRFRPASSPAGLRDEPSARAGSFFKRLDDPLVLRRMARPCADVREAELLQKLSDIALVEVDAEPLGDDALEVDPPPAHDAVLLTIRAGLDDLRELEPVAPPTGEAWDPPSSCRSGPSGPEALKRWTQSRSVWRSMPPIFAADPRSIPSLTAASDRSRRLWLTSFDRRASARSSFAE